MESGAPAATQRALQFGGALFLIAYLVNREWLDFIAVVGGAAVFLIGRAGYRWLYFHNSEFTVDTSTLRHTNALGLSRSAERSTLDHLVVTRGSMPTFMSPAIAPKLLVWSKAGQLALKSSAKYFAPEDLKNLCSVLAVPTDGPDGVWVE